MPPEASSALIEWFVNHFASTPDPSDGSALGAIVYEMFGLQDAFGQVMMNNLRASTPLFVFQRCVSLTYQV
jgi:[phosphatase 2A protein]-leucine-carboxy methyltransferase